jgi:hypothetical protein
MSMTNTEKIKAKADAIVENMHNLYEINKKLTELQIAKDKLQLVLTQTVGQWTFE